MTVQDYEYTGETPLNREPPLEDLISSFITEKDGYDRNHGQASRTHSAHAATDNPSSSPIPTIDAHTHRVAVDGAVRTPLSLSLADLRSLPQHTVICALQCAGNRRHTMRTEQKEVHGLDWLDGAVMNCAWRGPRLRDVLLRAGIALPPHQQAGAHVAFACHQTPCQDESWYGASIPLAVALRADADVLVALEMNNAPLPPNHGFPARIVAPGVAGARCVKWLDRVTLQPAESPNFYQQRDYKILPPHVDSVGAAARAWHTVPAIQDMPVNSVVGVPASGAVVERSQWNFRGCAYSGYGEAKGLEIV
ncbi:putative sulfite oxidase [Neofusicoccum parvum]|uniref:Sulfite oxidase n=1 Tax=Neofusicoccum parvum TaxID=310453 RepID=A0ACB5SED8_9PEZI|nr:putative sulfite oxidase [Neofusicoccum parvum]